MQRNECTGRIVRTIIYWGNAGIRTAHLAVNSHTLRDIASNVSQIGCFLRILNFESLSHHTNAFG